MRTTQMRGWMVAGAVAVAVAGVAGWMAHRAQADGSGAPGSATKAGSGWDKLIGSTGEGDAAQADASPKPVMTPEQVRNRLFKEGSFAGTEPAGDWCVNTGQLKPCPELRKRFEYYILGLGEVGIEDIKVLVADEARKANGDALSQQIMSLWDKYWQLRNHPYRNKFDQSDRSTWMPVFEEQKAARRQLLGADWAKAFFEQDEATFQQYYAQLESGQPPPPDPGEPVPQMAPGKDPAAVRAERVARYGEAAADRLAKADEEWADWERRLAGARAEWDKLKAAPNLSDAQRKQDMQAYIGANFKPDEHLRVQALLHL